MSTRALLLLSLLLSACGDKDDDSGAADGTDGTTDGTDGAADGTDGTADGTDGTADGTDGTDGTTGDVSWSDDAWPIIEGHCLPCHQDDDFHPGFLITDAETTYTTFTTDEPDNPGTWTTFVNPGDADGSLLIDKIAKDEPAYGGARMPTNGDYISDAEIDVIKAWIDQGAQNN